jgi:hypothetical protein
VQLRWNAEGTVYQNDTGPVLEFLFLQQDGQTVRDLTGYCGWVSFAYPGSAPHVVRAGQVDAANGIIRYFPQGDEFPTVGDILFQATAMLVDAAGTDRAWFEVSHPLIRRRVVTKP